MSGIQKFESGQHACRDVKFRSLAGAPVGRVRKYSEKEMDQPHLDVLRTVVAVQRAEAGGAQKRARPAWPPEEARKKYRGDYAQVNDLKDSVNSSAGACIIVGQREISTMEFRNYLHAEQNLFRTDQPSMKSSPTVPKQDYSPTPSYPKTPPNSPQIENSHPHPHMKGSSSNRETTFKVPNVLSTLEEPGEGREECQNGVTTSTEKVPANTAQPLPRQPSIVTRQELPVDTCPPPAQPQTDNISGAVSPALRRLPIKALLNTSRAEDVKPPQPTTMKTTSSGQPVTDTGLGKLQGEVLADCQPHVERSPTSRRTLSKIASDPETLSRGQTSGASELTLVRASERKSAPGPRSDGVPLEGSVVAQKLAMVGKVLIPKSDTPDSIVMLSIDPLLSQDAPDFFRFYSQIAGAGEAPVLCFGLPDVTWQRHQTQNISRGDFDSFQALKRTIWYCFCTFLTRGPGSAIFRVMVTAPARQEADDTVTISRSTAGRNECSRASAPLARPMCHNPAASHAELVHSLPSASQASLSNTKISSCQRVVPRGSQPTLRSRDAGPPTQREHSTAGFPTIPKNSTRKTLRDRLSPLQIAPAPQHHHPLVLPPALAYRQDKPVSETSSAFQIVVQIQENEHFQFSRPYSKRVLLSEATTMDFFPGSPAARVMVTPLDRRNQSSPGKTHCQNQSTGGSKEGTKSIFSS